MATNKRRRTTADDTTLHISDIPVGILVDAASYLCKPSRAIFAAALTAQSSSWQTNENDNCVPSDLSKAILSSNHVDWETLDFEDIGENLAGRLDDNDMHAILTCIDAKHVLKKLKLAGCKRINGSGLQPLTGSSVLELINLSTVGRNKKHREPTTIDPVLISQEAVLPILDSIIASDGCLKYIMFPISWSGREPTNSMEAFRLRYDQFFYNRGLGCTTCASRFSEENSWLTFYTGRTYQNNICYDCLRPFCLGCRFANADDQLLRLCEYCGREYCNDCVPVKRCAGCTKYTCSGCGEICDKCDKTWCKDCHRGNLFKCVCCKTTVCVSCPWPRSYSVSYMRGFTSRNDFKCGACKYL